MNDIKIEVNKENTLFTSDDTKSILFKQGSVTYLLIKIDSINDADETINNINEVIDEFNVTLDEANREKNTDYALDNMDEAYQVLKGES